MAGREIVPYGVNLNKKPNALALSVILPREMAPVPSNQSYFAQAIHRPSTAAASTSSRQATSTRRAEADQHPKGDQPPSSKGERDAD